MRGIIIATNVMACVSALLWIGVIIRRARRLSSPCKMEID